MKIQNFWSETNPMEWHKSDDDDDENDTHVRTQRTKTFFTAQSNWEAKIRSISLFGATAAAAAVSSSFNFRNYIVNICSLFLLMVTFFLLCLLPSAVWRYFKSAFMCCSTRRQSAHTHAVRLSEDEESIGREEIGVAATCKSPHQ